MPSKIVQDIKYINVTSQEEFDDGGKNIKGPCLLLSYTNQEKLESR